MTKIITFLGLWLALLAGCASPTGNESEGAETAAPPPPIAHTEETSVPPTLTATGITPLRMLDGETPTINAPEPTSTPTPSESDDFSLFLPQCDRQPLTELPTQLHRETGETWVRYANETYGFAFAFPPEWELVEGQNYLCLNYLPQRENKLIIGFKWFNDQQTTITRSGVAAGELTTDGAIQFLGREINRNILLYEGRDKAILYNNAAPVRISDLLFTLSLDDFSIPYETAELTPEIIQTADAIVASFELIDRLYVNENYGFILRRPPESAKLLHGQQQKMGMAEVIDAIITPHWHRHNPPA